MLDENTLSDPDGKKKLNLTEEVPAINPLTTPSVAQELAEEPKQGLTESEIVELKSKQRRNLIFAVIAGLFLAVLGFFAGGNARDKVDGAETATTVVTVTFNVEEASYVW